MIITDWEPLELKILHAGAEPRRRVVDTAQSQLDCLEQGSEQPIDSQDYRLAARSIVVLLCQAAA